MKRFKDEGGSVTIVMAGIVAVILLLGVALVGVVKSFVAAEKARAGGDQAALAAAATLLGTAPDGEPCVAAAQVAQRNGGRLLNCRVFPTSVQIEVTVPAPLGRTAHGVARAGAPEG